MAHATLIKFGYPASLVTESEHWAVLVRPGQVTLGSLVLCSKSDATAYGDLPRDAFADQQRMTALIERLLHEFVEYERINYLMLMMVDPHVHFHVIPRYQGIRSFAGVEFADSAWPGVPDLSRSQPAPTGLPEELRHLIAAKSL
jgi:diadenosine tetraphosphate (Ap4A) HIT family hydrolase